MLREFISQFTTRNESIALYLTIVSDEYSLLNINVRANIDKTFSEKTPEILVSGQIYHWSIY